MRVAGAIDIGATNTKIGVVDESGEILERATVPTRAQDDAHFLIDAIVATLTPMLDNAATRGASAAGIGVSVAGFVDRAHEMMYENANLPSLRGFPLRRTLAERFSTDCYLEVDSNASTLAEYRYGAGKGVTRLLGITVGTGVGGGVIIDGQLLRYTGECAGDVGHIILDPDGRMCTCGARGCFEAMVCSAALSERGGGKPVRDVVRAAREGDGAALKALEETGRWLGIGLASLAPVFAPERIVVGGGVASARELLLEPARAAFQEHAGSEYRERVEIAGSDFDGWEGVVGAGSIVHSNL